MCHTTLISTDDLAAHLDQGLGDRRLPLRPARTRPGDASNIAPGTFPARCTRASRTTSPAAAPARNGRHRCRRSRRWRRRSAGSASPAARRSSSTTRTTGLFASRLWWMLRYLGHDAVALLDGGWAKWTREGRPSRAAANSARRGLVHSAASRRDARRRRRRERRWSTTPAGAARRRARARALRRTVRDARPRRRPHPRRRQSLLQGEPRRRRDDAAAGAAAREVQRRCSAARRPIRRSCTAAPASAPATTCWRMEHAGLHGRRSTRLVVGVVEPTRARPIENGPPEREPVRGVTAIRPQSASANRALDLVHAERGRPRVAARTTPKRRSAARSCCSPCRWCSRC